VSKAHDLLASLLTRHRGEYVFRIGRLPPLPQLISGEPIEDTGWVGVTRTQAEVDIIRDMAVKVVEQIGGKVSTLFESRTEHPRIHLLLRLPPHNVSDVPEVRCAVVGNVDSGKSTTLGVLTRGTFFHSRRSQPLTPMKARLTMEGGGPALHYSDTNTRLRAGGLPALGWRSDFSFIATPPFLSDSLTRFLGSALRALQYSLRPHTSGNLERYVKRSLDGRKFLRDLRKSSLSSVCAKVY
jgi:hypothetical protein